MANLRKAVYNASSNLTITLASLATSSTLVAGRESTAVDNSTNLYLDYLLSGFITTGTSPTAGRIEVWVVPETDDSTWKQVAGTGDAAVTFNSVDIKAACGELAATMITDATSNRTYSFRKISVASLFGGHVCPRKFVVVVLHSTVVALNATAGNHQITVQGTHENLNA